MKKINILYFISIIIMVFFMSGCSRMYRIQIDSYKSSFSPKGNNFFILPGTNQINKNDLQFQEFSNYIVKVLEMKGYSKVDNIENSQVVIFVSYGIGDPQNIVYSYSIPTYGQIGGGTSTFSGSTYGSGGYSTTSGTINTLPIYGQTGSVPVVNHVTIYNRFLTLEGIDFTEFINSGQMVQLWKTMITSSGSSGDLRNVFPLMVGGSSEYIGTNTRKRISITIKENDIRVMSIKNER